MRRRKKKYQHAKKAKKIYYFITGIIILFLLGTIGWVIGYTSANDGNSIISKQSEPQESQEEIKEIEKVVEKDEIEENTDVATNQEEIEIVEDAGLLEENTEYVIENLEEHTTTYHTHEHVWVDIVEDIIYPEEGHMEKVLVKEAVYEEVPIYEKQSVLICSGCGEDITGNPWQHREDQLAIGNNGCIAHYEDEQEVQVGTEKKLVSEEVYEDQWVVDKEEQIVSEVVGHKCDICGEIEQ